MAADLPPDQPPQPPSWPPEPPPPPAPGPAPLRWEQPGYPALEGLYETAKLFLLRPSEAFTRMSTAGDIGKPLVFAVVFGWVGIIAGQIWQLLMPGVPWRFFPGMEHSMDFTVPFVWTIGTMILAPIFVLLAVFIWSAIVHLFLLIVGGAGGGFTATVRVVCYASSCYVVQIVPFCGGFIAFLWSTVLGIVGLAIAHRTSQGKAAVGVLLPIALCCACIVLAVVAFGAAILAAIGAGR